ncbi:MAG: ABC transporter ATP-binding protein [Alphaproteobacteria bacterium]|nr:ABC transporter ATP-binding protein [Alphaproteobacteria bacterium]
MSNNESIIEIKNVNKIFGGQVKAVDDVSIDIKRGEFFALLGPSGCGKTTLLRMLAGFETPTDGEILIDGQNMDGISPNHRPVNMVFQSYAVFPHMSVFENVAYGLKIQKVSKAEIANRVNEALEMVQLGGYGERKPDELSGGQRQRVALARALVKKPKVLLLDEPLSALDAKLREAMQMELVRLQHKVGITFVMVTHDQDEALSMADRIAVMESGKLQQLAPPREVYEFPSNRFVADFIGQMNLFEATVKSRDGNRLNLDVDGIGAVALDTEVEADGRVGIAVRPEKTSVATSSPEGDVISLCGTVEQIGYFGNESHIYLNTDDGHHFATAVRNESRSDRLPFAEGDKVWVSWEKEDTLILNH